MHTAGVIFTCVVAVHEIANLENSLINISCFQILGSQQLYRLCTLCSGENDNTGSVSEDVSCSPFYFSFAFPLLVREG